ncbi:hypothetical protein GGR53DRAFT_508025 [Hypoxylon sp. FL1150]|nr:hypothetical protein GGR53DRAFT_508025 [Hypoxylon sp. FL1150]
MSSRNAWTEGEKMSFLNQVIVQLTGNGAHVDFEALDMPGRTTKALRHQMEHVRKEGAAHQKQNGQVPTTATRGRPKGVTAGTPTKRATTGKRAKPHDEEDEEEEDDLEVPTTRRLKRQRRAPRGVKKEASESDADTIIAAKSSDGGAAGSSPETELAAADVKNDPEDSGLDLDDEA